MAISGHISINLISPRFLLIPSAFRSKIILSIVSRTVTCRCNVFSLFDTISLAAGIPEWKISWLVTVRFSKIGIQIRRSAVAVYTNGNLSCLFLYRTHTKKVIPCNRYCKKKYENMPRIKISESYNSALIPPDARLQQKWISWCRSKRYFSACS
jgi:hypothetical protein